MTNPTSKPIGRGGFLQAGVAGLPQPKIVAPDLPALADQMIKLWKS